MISPYLSNSPSNTSPLTLFLINSTLNHTLFSPTSTYHHADPPSSPMSSRGHWRPSEDQKLRQLVQQYGPHNWNAIAEKLQGRSGRVPSVTFEKHNLFGSYMKLLSGWNAIL
ncbi:putative transcription factor MYB-related family [Helianthus annuus]|nr:putative transcription factor MYB-related family [Helianthus annuus]